MAKHKAPTEVTVAPLFEKSVLERTLDRFKGPAVAVIVVVVAWILYNHFTSEQSRRQRDKSWEALIAATTPDMLTRLPTAPPETLAGLADSLRDRDSGPWARLLEIQKRIDERDFDGALAALDALRGDHPDHPLVAMSYAVGDEIGTPADRLQRVAEERKAWEAEHPGLFANPAPADDSPRVRLVTSSGDIEIALDVERAPQHVENFLELCGTGYYDGTKFHRVQQGFMIQGGDPNSREGDPATWGQGGPEHTLAAEPNDLYHFAGVLSAAKKTGETEESGSQFFLTTGAAHHLDGQHTIFGQVVAGMDIVEAIAAAPVVPEGAQDRPQNPVSIESTEVLE